MLFLFLFPFVFVFILLIFFIYVFQCTATLWLRLIEFLSGIIKILHKQMQKFPKLTLLNASFISIWLRCVVCAMHFYTQSA